MIGALPLSDYAVELSFLNDRYNLLLSEPSAKEAYKKKRGYKIAWNWVNEKDKFLPGYERRIERNRKQAIYRLTRKFDLSFLSDLRTGNNTDFSSTQILIAGPYWKVGGSFMLDWTERTEGRGITAVFGIWDSESKAQKTYRDSLQREIAVRAMIRQCGEWQSEDDESARPVIEFISGIVKNVSNLVYFNMIVTR